MSDALRREDLPDGSVRIYLDVPIADMAEPKTTFVIRRPTIGEQMRLGDPLTWVVDDKASMPIIARDLVEHYARLLITGHDADVIFRTTNMRLGVMIEEIILGFFRNARMSLKA